MSIEPSDLEILDIGITSAVATFVEAMGMHAENQHRLQRDETIAFDEKSFDDLIVRNRCHWDAVIERWER